MLVLRKYRYEPHVRKLWRQVHSDWVPVPPDTKRLMTLHRSHPPEQIIAGLLTHEASALLRATLIDPKIPGVGKYAISNIQFPAQPLGKGWRLLTEPEDFPYMITAYDPPVICLATLPTGPGTITLLKDNDVIL